MTDSNFFLDPRYQSLANELAPGDVAAQLQAALGPDVPNSPAFVAPDSMMGAAPSVENSPAYGQPDITMPAASTTLDPYAGDNGGFSPVFDPKQSLAIRGQGVDLQAIDKKFGAVGLQGNPNEAVPLIPDNRSASLLNDTPVEPTGGASLGLGSNFNVGEPPAWERPTTPDNQAFMDQARRFEEAKIEAGRQGLINAHLRIVEENALREDQQKIYNEQVQKQQFAEKTVLAAQDNVVKMNAELDDAYKKGIDPSAYWTNQSAASKAFSLLAGFAFGYTGKGMDWVQHLDQLVRDDVNLQMQRKAQGIQGAQFKRAGATESLAEAKAHKGEIRADYNFEVLQRLKTADQRLSSYAESTKDAERQANIEAGRLELQKLIGTTAEKYTNDAFIRANMEFDNKIAAYNAKFNAISKVARGVSAEGRFMKIPAGVQTRLVAAKTTLDGLNAMINASGEGLYEAGAAAIKRLVPGTDVSTADKLANFYAAEMTRMYNGTESMHKAYKEMLLNAMGAAEITTGKQVLHKLHEQVLSSYKYNQDLNSYAKIPDAAPLGSNEVTAPRRIDFNPVE